MADYDELIKKYGGTKSPSSTSADLSALIAKHGGTVESPKAQEPKAEAKMGVEDVIAPIPRTMDGMTRATGLATRAMAPTALGAAVGSLGGPVGTLVGSMAVPAADALGSLINLIASPFTDYRLPSTSSSIQNLMTKAGVPGAPETQTPTERVLSAGLESMTGVASSVPAAIKLAAQRAPTMTQQAGKVFAEAPKTQAIVSPTSVIAGQAVTEATGNPLAGLATSLATGTTGSIKRPKMEESLSSSTLSKIASDRYKALEEAGIQLKQKNFTDRMKGIGADLRKEGYTPTAYPKVKAALDELTNLEQPKDWTELQALRKMIRGAQKSMDSEERALGSILMDEYDDYLMNVPDSDVVFGNAKNVGKMWKDARSVYSKMKKAEVFEDMLDNAKLDRSKFTQSGYENALAQQLRQLAKNDKKMRLFTKDEQEAIRQAAQGGTAQNILKFFGRFAPTGPVSGIFTGSATVYNPAIGVPMALGASAARVGATKMREQSINDLVNQMRLGQRPQVTGGPLRAVPANAIRGLLSTDQMDRESNYWMGM